ncbi:uncharacterized protein [Watersipora subatra]|uniref:uncharacterized protein n=1 Tax=Watersipora subatra TaxID=2589382 RepID=UPI00355C912A
MAERSTSEGVVVKDEVVERSIAMDTVENSVSQSETSGPSSESQPMPAVNAQKTTGKRATKEKGERRKSKKAKDCCSAARELRRLRQLLRDRRAAVQSARDRSSYMTNVLDKLLNDILAEKKSSM